MEKKVGAPKDNRNAETWTLKEANYVFEQVSLMLNNREFYAVAGLDGYSCHFLGEACSLANTTIDKLKYARDKYNLKGWYQELKRKSESNCFTDTKKGIINTGAGIMNLKSNHGWTDRVQQDNTTKGEKINTQFIVSSQEQADQLNNFLDEVKKDANK